MNTELISKKELLELTGISYGQLYRWKRERLLPEEWFMKRSSYTGQETYFPRKEALERIKTINELKDKHSLGDIAAALSPVAGVAISINRMSEILEADADYLAAVITRIRDEDEVFRALPADSQMLSFSEAVLIGALGTLVKNKVLEAATATELALDGRLLAHEWVSENMACDVLVIGSDDPTATNCHLALYKLGSKPVFSKRIHTLVQLPLAATSANIKRTLQNSDTNN